MLKVGAIERVGVEEDGDGFIERHAVFVRVGLRLARIPLEHLFSIYEMRRRLHPRPSDGMSRADSSTLADHTGLILLGHPNRVRSAIGGSGLSPASWEMAPAAHLRISGQMVPAPNSGSVPLHSDEVISEEAVAPGPIDGNNARACLAASSVGGHASGGQRANGAGGPSSLGARTIPMLDYLDALPINARPAVAKLAAHVIKRATALGGQRWGATPYEEGFRVNVGWTEILTADSDHLALVVSSGSVPAAVPPGARRTPGRGNKDFYPSVPGSVRLEIAYSPLRRFEAIVNSVMPSLEEAIRLAGRRRAGRGVKAGHRQALVWAISNIAGQALPAPGYIQQDPSAESNLKLMEGALVRVSSSRYERNSSARRACVAHHGSRCAVCSFSFETAFGKIGRGFIHVHHLIPLASRKRRYVVDPIRHMLPVCPNCHAMLHTQEPPLSIEDAKRHLGLQRRLTRHAADGARPAKSRRG